MKNEITIGDEKLKCTWCGTMVPYSMAWLNPRHVRALGHHVNRRWQYAIRDGNELVRVLDGGYTASLAKLPLPAIHINP